ncbi:serine/threonine-protein phosphatase 6 regulatory subunit 3-like isoform X3 [Biomphalaria pfeifferi]|uniref:Serine/threonine-protein phosphatase 6 regulatory subunit 3-like isoform X3 n=1 Tax=Biomphalaria pfeifferi TaxID=112525 RepID=A0AAD8EZ01_BIOPF|nr:serine/threonine-protein phosphatase 6 regulatory subunit 3-like isoform X3 [Biomphalaria pfeifferi]
MFWKFNLLTSSHIDTLLDKEDVTLRELMDEDDILQECKAQNRKLVEFLIQPENMEEMVKLITVEPPLEVDEKIRFKYPNTACELLTSDVTQINDKLAGDEGLVDKLYSFLEGEKPLNPLLASFFSKVMGLLITRKSDMIFEYLKAKSDFVGSLLHHIGTSAVMDLLLRLITCIESSETRRAVIEWLNEQKIVEKLVDSIVAEKDEDIHCNAAQSLCDIVRLGREQFIQQQDSSDPDPLLMTMEQEATVAKLLSNMFNSGKNESVLVNGLCVIHTLLEVRRQGMDQPEQLSNGDHDRFSQGINNVISAIIPRLKDFHDLLENPPLQRYSVMPTSVGILEPPLGNTRLQVSKLVTALVGANMHDVNVELTSLGTIQTLLNLYFKYEWNNFLHTQLEQCLLIILNNNPIEVDGKHEHPLLIQLFKDYNLIQRLLNEWEANDQQQNAPSGKRRGFMGHLTKMANSIAGLVEKSDSSSMVKDQFNGVSSDVRDKWDAFVAGALAEVNKRNTIELMRGHPLASSSEDDDADFKDLPFPQDTAMQQAFSDYQLQQMTSNFIDQFGFNDEDFAEQDEKIEAPFTNRISSIDADIQGADANQANVALFEQVCNEKIQQFDNDDSDEDIWEEKAITFDKGHLARHERLPAATARCNSSDEDSTDSGEELDSPAKIIQQHTEGMDVDSAENAWSVDSSSHSEHTAMDTTSSPWEKPTAPPSVPVEQAWADFSSVPTQSEEDNWADFTSFGDIQSSTGMGPRSSSPVEMDTTETTRSSAYVVSSNTNDLKSGLQAFSVPGVTSTENELHLADVEDETCIPDSTSHNPDLGDKILNSSTDNGEQPPLPDSSPPHLLNTSTTLTESGALTDSQVTSTSCETVQLANEDETHASNLVLSHVSSTLSGSCRDGSSIDVVVSLGTAPVSADSPSSSSTTEKGTSSSDGRLSPNNQSFLASSGLLKKASSSTVAAACPSRQSSEAQGNGPVSPPAASVPPAALSPSLVSLREDQTCSSLEPDTTECTLTQAQKIERARAQAKEAQEKYDAAAVVHNGPV